MVSLPESVGVVDDPANELIVADMDWRRAVWTPGPDAAMRWEPARYRTAFAVVDGGVDLTVEADSLVRDLLVQPDRVAAGGTVDRGFMTLLPGERVVFRLRGVTEADVPALWECPRCGAEARATSGIEPEVKAEKPARTHWDMLLERRSVKELEDILTERLELLRGGEIGPAHLHRASARKKKASV